MLNTRCVGAPDDAELGVHRATVNVIRMIAAETIEDFI